MTLTILLDLDDTLLSNQVDTFLPAYLDLFSKHVSHLIEPDLFIKALMFGTQKMVENQRPDVTLRQVFETEFFSMVDVDRNTFEKGAVDFYKNVFPELRSLTNPIPDAVAFVNEALELGNSLAITTNPLFPLTAILQRLEWAGLPADKYKFDLIASYETFHFSKPNPAYFAETLGSLGWPTGPIVVVGDDYERDIVAGHQMGLSTFYINGCDSLSPGDWSAADHVGDISDLHTWVEKRSDEHTTPEYESISSLLGTLRSTPAVMDSLFGSLTPDRRVERPVPDEWCPTEIVCHLRDVEREVNLPRVKSVMEESNPFLSAEDTDQWAGERQYICQDGWQAFQDFTATRMSLLDRLSQVTEGEWYRPARHSIFGRTHLKEMVSIIAGHDRLHIQQMHRDIFSKK